MNDPAAAQPLERGVFTLSLDFELIWGTLDLYGEAGFRRACEIERELVPRLLQLLAGHCVSATWCTVGHLFLESCPKGPSRHPEIVPPRHAWAGPDWFARDPGGDERSQPLFFAPSLIREIQACPVPQEIGSHSFSHMIFGDVGCSRLAAASDLAACQRAARAMGVELVSFAFPRNSVGHLDVLREHGFEVFRGPGPRWYEQQEPPGLWARLYRLRDVLCAAAPPVFEARQAAPGLWDVPGSMVYQPMHGLRRLIPLRLRIARARKGLAAAAEHKKVFHLWFHPTNLGDETEAMFFGLEQILAHASALRDRGLIENRTMSGLRPRAGAAVARPEPGPRLYSRSGAS